MADDNGNTRTTVAVLGNKLDEFREQTGKDLARIEGKVDANAVHVQSREDRLDSIYVRKEDFEPIKSGFYKIIFAIVGLFLAAVGSFVFISKEKTPNAVVPTVQVTPQR